jgi:hypothetical protein
MRSLWEIVSVFRADAGVMDDRSISVRKPVIRAS